MTLFGVGDDEEPGPEQRSDEPEPAELADSAPGIGITHEAARRRQREGRGADLSWRIGADGEAEVGGRLNRFCEPSRMDRWRGRRPPWRVRHGIEFVDERGDGHGDIDHLVVGPPGLVTINTKHHRLGRVVCDGDRITVNRRDHPYVRKARREADRVREQVVPALVEAGLADLAARLVISPAIVMMVATFQMRRPAPGVLVLPVSELEQRLHQMSKRLDPGEVEAVYAVVSRRATWRMRSS